MRGTAQAERDVTELFSDDWEDLGSQRTVKVPYVPMDVLVFGKTRAEMEREYEVGQLTSGTATPIDVAAR